MTQTAYEAANGIQPPTSTVELLAERGKTHGDFKVHAGCTQHLKECIELWLNESGKKHNGLSYIQRESLNMICHKIGRIVAGDPDFRDHWDDIAGYAKLVADRCSK